jgi:hypothetical protein
MNKLRIFFAISFVLFLTMQTLIGQEQNTQTNLVTFDFNADLVSRYVWRGTQFGDASPNIQPGVALNCKGLSVGAWGAYSLGGVNTAQEFDLFLSYTFLNDMFTATLTDYYLPDDTATYNYFEWNKDLTGHLLEGTLAFNGTDKLPIHFLAAFNFYGADAVKINNNSGTIDFNTSDGIQFSNYFELGYSMQVQQVACDFFVGGTLNNPSAANSSTGYLGESGFYGDGAGIVNLGFTASKELEITDKYALPISASVITNPQAKKIFFVFGISF